MVKILLLETDHLLAKNLRQFLKNSGYEVDWQVDPQAAIESADTVPPDAIVLDLMLAQHSGIEFLYEFRSYPEWQNLPVIIFSNISAEEVSGCLEAFEQLNVSAYHYKLTTSLAKLADSVDRSLQSAIV